MTFSLEDLGGMGEISVANALVIILFISILASILFGTSEPYTHFRRLGQPWYLSFLPSKPVHELVAQGYREVSKISVILAIKTNSWYQSKEPFVVRWWALDWLVLGPRYLSDLKHRESTSLSFFRVISDVSRSEQIYQFENSLLIEQ